MQIIKRIPYYGSLVLLVYMPFHIFLSQWLSTFTGGLSIWKIAKDVVTAGLVVTAILLVWQQRKTSKVYYWFIGLAVIYGCIHLLIWALNPEIYRKSAELGLVYNNRIVWYLLVGMGAAMLWHEHFKENKIIRIVLSVSTAVCLLGIIQYFLPKDVMTHFGYSIARGVKPAFFIDDKPDLPRIMSTLRDPNSLGAYLILPITLLIYKLFNSTSKKRTVLLVLLALHITALFLTFSRSAWLGTIISIGILSAYNLREKIIPWVRRYWLIALVAMLVVGSLILVFRNQYAVQNILVHSDKSTAAKSQYDSNGYHLLLTERGLKGIWHKPLGHGPGTAGIVSIQNPSGGFLTENYYIQIGYEVGVLGLLVFMAINVLIYKQLLKNKSPLAICLLVSFWGYVLVNMLLHIWSNEAVAVQWWLLAGMSLGYEAGTKKVKKL